MENWRKFVTESDRAHELALSKALERDRQEEADLDDDCVVLPGGEYDCRNRDDRERQEFEQSKVSSEQDKAYNLKKLKKQLATTLNATLNDLGAQKLFGLPTDAGIARINDLILKLYRQL